MELCRNICPLVAGNADEIEAISTGTLRSKTVFEKNIVIGHIHVLVEPKFDTTAQKGIGVPQSATACAAVQDRLNFVRQKRGGAMGGTLSCPFTRDSEYVSGISKVRLKK